MPTIFTGARAPMFGGPQVGVRVPGFRGSHHRVYTPVVEVRRGDFRVGDALSGISALAQVLNTAIGLWTKDKTVVVEERDPHTRTTRTRSGNAPVEGHSIFSKILYCTILLLLGGVSGLFLFDMMLAEFWLGATLTSIVSLCIATEFVRVLRSGSPSQHAEGGLSQYGEREEDRGSSRSDEDERSIPEHRENARGVREEYYYPPYNPNYQQPCNPNYQPQYATAYTPQFTTMNGATTTHFNSPPSYDSVVASWQTATAPAPAPGFSVNEASFTPYNGRREPEHHIGKDC